jgi:hypothetical protein
MKGASPFPHCLHFPNHIPHWFEDLDKGNVLHIKLYYLYELIIMFHASLRISIDIYSNQNYGYRWQLVTIPRMCTLQQTITTFLVTTSL